VPAPTAPKRVLGLFTESDVHDLATQGGVSPPSNGEAIAEALDTIARTYLNERSKVKARQSPTSVSRDLSSLTAACKKAAARLGDKQANLSYLLAPRAAIDAKAHVLRGVPPAGEGRVGQERVMAALAVLKDLIRWSERADSNALARKRTRKRHEGDPALTDVVESLMALWIETWNRKPSVSRSSEKPEPFVRFVLRYFEILVSRLPAQVFEKDVGLRKALSPTAHAIRGRIKQVWHRGQITDTK
jgi:hypothetical protein